MTVIMFILFFFFFNDTATTEIYTLSLHDALPILRFQKRNSRKFVSRVLHIRGPIGPESPDNPRPVPNPKPYMLRSEEHTSELQSRQYLVCRLLLEKKKKKKKILTYV